MAKETPVLFAMFFFYFNPLLSNERCIFVIALLQPSCSAGANKPFDLLVFVTTQSCAASHSDSAGPVIEAHNRHDVNTNSDVMC